MLLYYLCRIIEKQRARINDGSRWPGPIWDCIRKPFPVPGDDDVHRGGISPGAWSNKNKEVQARSLNLLMDLFEN